MPDETIHEAAPLAGRTVIPLDDLEHTRHAHEVEGVTLDPDVPFSLILVHSGPGVGPRSTAIPTRRCSWSRRARRRSGWATTRSS